MPGCAERPGSGRTTRLVALTEILLAALIWSSSFVGVKIALKYTGPFTVAGLRYLLAFVFLVPWLCRQRTGFRLVSRAIWGRLILMGVTQYLLGNGALFLSLKTLPATTGSLALCLSSIPVLVLARLWLKERLSHIQIGGVLVALAGSVLFFSRGLVLVGSGFALGSLGVAVLSISLFPILVREIARDRQVGIVILTAVPLGIGGGALLLLAIAVEGVPNMPLVAWGVVLGLALVNTLLAYLLYNHSLQHITAVEANVLLNLAPLGTALIAWGALGEQLTPLQVAAMVLVMGGASLAQRRKARAVLGS